jgi:hypothetical protein
VASLRRLGSLPAFSRRLVKSVACIRNVLRVLEKGEGTLRSGCRCHLHASRWIRSGGVTPACRFLSRKRQALRSN